MAATKQSVYVLYGKDAYLRDQARQRIVAGILGDADPQLSIATFDATAELAAVFDELRTLPFLAPHRVVIVHDAEAFITANREALEKYFDHPVETGTLILIVASWPKNTKLAKKLPSVGEAIECACPEGADLVRWVQNAVARHGCKIAPAAANLLADCVGPDLAGLDNELEKLATYISGRDTIQPADISAIVTATSAPEAFALANAITQGDARAALGHLMVAMTSRGAEFALLGQLAWHIRRALQVQQGISAGQNPQAAMKAARVFYGQREFADMLRRRPMAKLQADMRKLIAADLGMKSGREPKAAMQQLVVELCG